MTLEELKAASFVVGRKETERVVEKNEALYVFIASDCDERIAGPLEKICHRAEIPFTREYAKKEIGKACGIKVKAAACAVLKS
ncbi:MAG: ribosomal L7Ae/L30e/S12e/Gadd45 family protein [Dialister sp.]|nr:ribosomal L7Ae/L30e/S12e/Gadd45 family protein [Dialister sp.]